MKHILLMISMIIGITYISNLNTQPKITDWKETVVFNGDTLWTIASPIAKDNNLDIRLVVDEIKEYNGIGTNIYPYQVIHTPVYERGETNE